MKNVVYTLLLISSLASAHELPTSILEKIPDVIQFSVMSRVSWMTTG